jgi:hypothetical protein
MGFDGQQVSIKVALTSPFDFGGQCIGSWMQFK